MEPDRGVDNRIDWPFATIAAGTIAGFAGGLGLMAHLSWGPKGWLGWLPILSIMAVFAITGIVLCGAHRSARTRTAGAALGASVLIGTPPVVALILFGAFHG